MQATVVVLTKLPDRLPVKTRLVPVLGEQGAKDFYRGCLKQSIALAHRLTADVRVAYSPADAPPPADGWFPVEGEDGATCLERALSDAFCGPPLVALGGDAPDLPLDRLRAAVAAMEEGTDAVFVPTGDGGFSALGLRRPVSGLAEGFRYGGADALESLDGWLRAQGLATLHLEPWPDIDSPEDLAAYRNRS